MNNLNGNHGDEDDDRLAALLVEFEARLAAGDPSTVGPTDLPLLQADETIRQRLSDAQDCVRLLEEIWPHERPLGDEVPRAIGRFQIVRELGRGGFGIVYLAHDEKLGRDVALKVQRPEALLSPALREHLREARTTARLGHPQIAAVYEVGESGLRIWIASEYVAGQTLAEFLRRVAHPLRRALPRAWWLRWPTRWNMPIAAVRCTAI